MSDLDDTLMMANRATAESERLIAEFKKSLKRNEEFIERGRACLEKTREDLRDIKSRVFRF
ncbi:MAG: hypothetical protein AVDCRST_MAG74-2827 [uncultured Pyrinomonadaceae bacterium]|uniref:Uncharacterized protein n=1 Tax=uncultured Pyrinomonadaceae bacterium TaxID=2283094 RepID=A0A6J4PLJ5_9BACT|nr:MAG: hypothetical protein AVDCRST_MAG74-2827 [uncultured Pyrinomonadaceae bacterium]